MGSFGNGTARVSTDGGKTWRELPCSQFELVRSDAGEVKEVKEVKEFKVSTGTASFEMQISGPLTSVEIDEALVKATADHGRYVLAPEAPKKTAQWKQNPLSRYRK